MASSTFKLISWNTGGDKKMCDLLSMIVSDKPDIVLLQEVKCNEKTLNTLVNNYF